MPVRKSAIESAPMQEFYRQKPNYQTAGKQLAMVRAQDVARVFVPNGQQIAPEGAGPDHGQQGAGRGGPEGHLAASLQKECDAVAKQVKAIEG